jgi:hypothetical protein
MKQANYTPKSEPIKAAGLKHRTIFSFKQPSPQWARNLFNIWTAFAGVAALILVTFNEYIPSSSDDIVSRILIVGTPALRIITKAFGIEIKDK